MLTEIHEFALSLTPITKGQETFGGLPHLQAYKLLHAVRLADINLTSKASKSVAFANFKSTYQFVT